MKLYIISNICNVTESCNIFILKDFKPFIEKLEDGTILTVTNTTKYQVIAMLMPKY